MCDALRNSGGRAGDVVAVHGIGGLGHLGVQYARRMGFKTVAINRGNDKEQLAIKLGAHHYIDATAKDVVAELQKLGGARVILVEGISRPRSKSRPENFPNPEILSTCPSWFLASSFPQRRYTDDSKTPANLPMIILASVKRKTRRGHPLLCG